MIRPFSLTMITPTIRWTTRKLVSNENNYQEKTMYLDWFSIHPQGIEGVLENSPKISDHSLDCDHSLDYDQFISAILKNNDYKFVPTTTLLRKMLKEYPEYVWIVKDYFGNFELCFRRGTFKRILEKPYKIGTEAIVIESFERGLKHAGLEVIQSTHGGSEIKKWRIKRKENNYKNKILKRDRDDSNDDSTNDDSKLKLVKLEIETVCKCPAALEIKGF